MRALFAVGIVASIGGPAFAHFKLDAPASFQEQDSFGNPQKVAPCGEAGMATNAVTAVQTGSMLTIKITETVFHPGHYRVALAQDQASLPAEPPVTGTQCNSVPIEQNPTLPTLADGQLVHTTQFTGPQTMQVQLPVGMECTNCVVQVLEFMSSHAPPCFYHHCAMVTISNTAPPVTPDAGVTPPGDDAGTGGGGGDATGGCCSTSGGTPAGSIGLALGLALVWRRRRR